MSEVGFRAFCQLVCKCASADQNKKIKVTSSAGTVISTTTIGSSLVVKVIVPPRDKYTVQLLNGSTVVYTTYVVCGFGEYHELDMGLTTATWDGVKRIIDSGLAASYIHNGDRFTVTLSGGEVVYFEANVNTYGLGEVDFIPANCLANTRQHHTSNTNAGGWNASDLRTWLNQTFITSLPSDLQAVISAKPVKATSGSQVNQIVTSNDKIWIPTEKEVFGGITYSGSTENSVNNQYPVFTNAASRVRTQGVNGAAVNVWLASPHVSDSTAFCIVATSGAPYSNGASNSYGVLPCFRIAPAA
ncbi:MAG: hypothetical protein E7306_03570 [Butyrivibrio sp.]|nr:hypothetical protein [Butyrivibrio sp.]